MKNYLTLFLLFAIFPNLSNKAAQLDNKQLSIVDINKLLANDKNTKLINHYKKLLGSMFMQESSFDSLQTKGDGGLAWGILSIHTKMVDEANRILGHNKFTYEDRLSVEKSIEIFLIYQEYWNPSRELEIAARIWNGGPNAIERNISNDYWELIQNHMNEPNNDLLAEILINSANIQAV